MDDFMLVDKYIYFILM